MGNKKNYSGRVLDYLLEHGQITHNEIIKLTNTNCPYGVIRNLRKRGLNITDKTVKGKDGGTYKIFFYSAPETPKKEEFTQVNQLSLGLNIEKIKQTYREMRQKYGV